MALKNPEIRPLRLADLPELSRFLNEGFASGGAEGAAFAAPEVLRWKFLEPIGEETPERSWVAEAEGRIVGHVGVFRARFVGGGVAPEGVSTVHMIDWLGSKEFRGVGAALMRRAHQGAETQYVLVANEQARRVTGGAGYEPRAEVPIYRRVLRPGYRWREPEHGVKGRLLRVGKDTVRALVARSERPRVDVELRRVSTFGAEVGPIVADAGSRGILTDRSPARLNHALGYPSGTLEGVHILSGGDVVGFGVLNVVSKGKTRGGKIVECLLKGEDRDLWHASIAAMTGALADRGADFVLAFGSTPWMAEGLRRSGFAEAGRIGLTVRDRRGRIPRDATFHVTPLEADDAYG